MNKLVPVGIGLGLVVVAGLVGACGSNLPQAAAVAASPAPVTAEPVAVATAPVASAAAPTAGPVTDVLTGGRYLFRPIADVPSLTIEATGPNGWTGYPSWAMDGPEPVRADAPAGIGIAFFSANGLYRDPCHWDVRGTGVSLPAGAPSAPPGRGLRPQAMGKTIAAASIRRNEDRGIGGLPPNEFGVYEWGRRR